MGFGVWQPPGLRFADILCWGLHVPVVVLGEKIVQGHPVKTQVRFVGLQPPRGRDRRGVVARYWFDKKSSHSHIPKSGPGSCHPEAFDTFHPDDAEHSFKDEARTHCHPHDQWG